MVYERYFDRWLVFLLIVCGITAVAFVPACVAVTQDVVHPGLRAISLSLNIIIQHLLGSSLAPVVVVDQDTYGSVKADKVIETLEKYE